MRCQAFTLNPGRSPVLILQTKPNRWRRSQSTDECVIKHRFRLEYLTYPECQLLRVCGVFLVCQLSKKKKKVSHWEGPGGLRWHASDDCSVVVCKCL